jgi:hypothetical protein
MMVTSPEIKDLLCFMEDNPVYKFQLLTHFYRHKQEGQKTGEISFEDNQQKKEIGPASQVFFTGYSYRLLWGNLRGLSANFRETCSRRPFPQRRDACVKRGRYGNWRMEESMSLTFAALPKRVTQHPQIFTFARTAPSNCPLKLPENTGEQNFLTAYEPVWNIGTFRTVVRIPSG